MREVLLDSHTLNWSIDDPAKLSAAATLVLNDPSVRLIVRIATEWETSIKCGKGKLPLPGRVSRTRSRP